MSSATLYGPRGDDFYDIPVSLDSFSPTSYRYWRISYTSSSGQKFTHSKVHFGRIFDFGKDPSRIVPKRRPAKQGRFRPGSGSEHLLRLDEEIYVYDMTWTGISDDKVRDFFSKIADYKEDNSVFLITTSDHTVLDSLRVLHCQVSNVSARPASELIDWNEVRATFTEVLG